MQLLLVAHERDSTRRLEDVPAEVSTMFESEIWVNTVLKAALVRLATLEVCGSPVGPSDLAQQIRSAALNQFGDDLWDIREDIDSDRVTPFTVFLSRKVRMDPFRFYVSYCIEQMRQASRRRRFATLMGVQETCRCLLDSFAHRTGKRDTLLRIEKSLAGALSLIDADLDSNFLREVPHIDPDAVVFGLANSILD